MEPAPFLSDIAEGPQGGRAFWLHAADDTRIRVGVWPEGPKGTILMFPGRTEYIEKYGRVAKEFAARGYGMVAVDWRGQGLSDRPAHRHDMGHVVSFDEYREDVAALRQALRNLDLKNPCFLLGHSMGGAIGLRALYDGLPACAVVFTSPMWGIRLTGFLRAISGIVLGLSKPLGLDKNFAPTTGPAAPMVFDGNPLTRDRSQFDYMESQVALHPELALGGPSITWVHAALEETGELLEMEPLDIPNLTFLGTEEEIVEPAAVHERMDNWPNGRLEVVEQARHEVLMETPDLRTPCIDAITDWFDRHSSAEAKAG
jgi:lysophospholipase